MDYFEAIKRRRHAADREAEGLVADNMDYRTALVARVKAGEITLEEAQRQLRATQRKAKASGQITRNQAWRGR